MKKRKNIIISVITCMMSICLMMFGVYSASNPNVSISGQVSYLARDAKVLVLGKVNGQAGEDQDNKVAYPAVADTTNPQQSEKVVNASQYMGFTNGTSANDDTDNLAPWSMNTTHEFYEDATGIRPIKISFKMTNLSNYPVVATVDFTGVTDANLASKNLTRTTTGLEENKVYLNKNVTKEITISYAVANDAVSVNGDNLLNMSITFEKTLISPTPVDGEIEIINDGKNQKINQSDWEYIFDGKNFALTKFVGEFPAKVNGESTLIVPNQVKCDDGKIYPVKTLGSITEEQVNAAMNGEIPEDELYAGAVIVDLMQMMGDESTAMAYFQTLPTNIVVSEGIEIISPVALAYATGVTQLPSSVKEIGSLACAGTSITTLDLPSLTRIGMMAFSFGGDLCAPLTSVTIPSGVTEIGMMAFAGCSTLTSVTFAENSKLTEIGMNAFYKTGLTSVSIPDSVANMGEGAFSCSTLTTVNISQNDPTKQQCGEFVFGQMANLNENLKIYVPTRLYKEAQNWSVYKDYMVAPAVDTVSEETVGDWKVQINSDDTANIIGYIGDTTKQEITIPSTITYKGKAYKVYAVGDTNNYETIVEAQEANMIFYNDTIISVMFGEGNLLPVKKLIVEDGIYVIGNYALGCLTSLEELVLPNTLMTIERGAFIGSPLTSITIPSGVSSIGDNAFATFAGGLMNDNNLSNNGYYVGTSENPYLVLLGIKDKTVSNFQINSETKFIQNEVFKDCTSLTYVSIPSAVTSIGTSAFEGCTSLKNVSINSDSNLINIDNSAFSGCSVLQTISLPNALLNIGETAFYQCSNLTYITVPNGVRSVGRYAFSGCESLKKSNNLHDNAYYLGNNTNPYVILFSLTDTSITSFQINENTKFISDNVFQNCNNLNTVGIPSGLRGIGESAFPATSGVSRVDITDMNSWLNIDFLDNYSNPLFAGSDGETSLYLNGTLVTEVSIPSSFTKVKDSVFAGYKKLTSVTISDTVTSIGDYAFYACSMTSVVIPNKVTNIGASAFSRCELLTSIAIPSSVTSIGNEAFRDCSGLTRVDITDMDSWLNIDFGSSASSNPLYCAHNLYLNGELVTKVTIPNGYTNLKDRVFAGCTSLTNVVLPETITSIGMLAFVDCTNLTSITVLATNPPKLGGQTFENCTKIAAIYVPASSVEAYKTAWTTCADKIQAIAG